MKDHGEWVTPGKDGLGSVVGFQSSSERIKTERESRIERARRVLPFGVKYLDLALGGIFPNDLILIGAWTGAGKTELSTLIALENARKGKHVHFLALEADESEIERRIKYRVVSDAVFAGGSSLRNDLNYMDWLAGRVDSELNNIESVIDKSEIPFLNYLHTLYRKTSFGLKELEAAITSIQDVTDLVILDHLHYVDTESDNENYEYKQIVKHVRDLAIGLGKPIVLVAHLRKRDRFAGFRMPTLDDFHGTSDITKICTKAILLAARPSNQPSDGSSWGTYMHAAKCRMDGSRTRYLALSTFDIRRMRYDDHFQLGWGVNDGGELDLVKPEALPKWAERWTL